MNSPIRCDASTSKSKVPRLLLVKSYVVSIEQLSHHRHDEPIPTTTGQRVNDMELVFEKKIKYYYLHDYQRGTTLPPYARCVLRIIIIISITIVN